MDKDNTLVIELEFPLENTRIAQIVYDVLRVESEPKRSGVSKILTLSDTIIKAHFSASLARQLRVAVSNFINKIDLTLETIQLLGPPVSNLYGHY